MVHLVVHAGFHKTGTKSVQVMIDANRATLDPVLRCYLKADILRLTELTRDYSTTRDRATLRAIRRAARAFFTPLADDDPRPILLSAEDLAGHMPGRQNMTHYAATPEIMAQITVSARAALGKETKISLYFSTRKAQSWLASLHWQNLRSTRLKEDLPEFSQRLQKTARFRPLLAAMRDATSPADVSAMPLHQASRLPEGPLSPILDLLGIAPDIRSSLTLLPPANVMPDDGLRDVFLALNRCGMDDAEVADAKRHILRLARRAPCPAQ